jgi:hypothetical protein
MTCERFSPLTSKVMPLMRRIQLSSTVAPVEAPAESTAVIDEHAHGARGSGAAEVFRTPIVVEDSNVAETEIVLGHVRRLAQCRIGFAVLVDIKSAAARGAARDHAGGGTTA